jgi:hypothetical protein
MVDVRVGTMVGLMQGKPSCMMDKPIQRGFMADVAMTATLPVCMKLSALSTEEHNSTNVGSGCTFFTRALLPIFQMCSSTHVKG